MKRKSASLRENKNTKKQKCNTQKKYNFDIEEIYQRENPKNVVLKDIVIFLQKYIENDFLDLRKQKKEITSNSENVKEKHSLINNIVLHLNQYIGKKQEDSIPNKERSEKSNHSINEIDYLMKKIRQIINTQLKLDSKFEELSNKVNNILNIEKEQYVWKKQYLEELNVAVDPILGGGGISFPTLETLQCISEINKRSVPYTFEESVENNEEILEIMKINRKKTEKQFVETKRTICDNNVSDDKLLKVNWKNPEKTIPLGKNKWAAKITKPI